MITQSAPPAGKSRSAVTNDSFQQHECVIRRPDHRVEIAVNRHDMKPCGLGIHRIARQPGDSSGRPKAHDASAAVLAVSRRRRHHGRAVVTVQPRRQPRSPREPRATSEPHLGGSKNRRVTRPRRAGHRPSPQRPKVPGASGLTPPRGAALATEPALRRVRPSRTRISTPPRAPRSRRRRPGRAAGWSPTPDR